jgi:hypothetical protein
MSGIIPTASRSQSPAEPTRDQSNVKPPDQALKLSESESESLVRQTNISTASNSQTHGLHKEDHAGIKHAHQTHAHPESHHVHEGDHVGIKHAHQTHAHQTHAHSESHAHDKGGHDVDSKHADEMSAHRESHGVRKDGGEVHIKQPYQRVTQSESESSGLRKDIRNPRKVSYACMCACIYG